LTNSCRLTRQKTATVAAANSPNTGPNYTKTQSVSGNATFTGIPNGTYRDAITGAVRYKIATSAGDAANPSGLTKLTAWIVTNADTNMLFNHVYGVDILGNVWRFDINDTMGPAGREATLLATLKDSAGTPQPITTKPIGALVGNEIMLFVGTGSYLSLTDLANSQVQTVYGFKDNLTTPASGALIPDVRATLAHQQMMTVGTGLAAVRGFATCQPAPNGWYVDLPDSKERVNVDMRRALGSLIVVSVRKARFSLKYCLTRDVLYSMCRLGCTPSSITRVRNCPGVDLMILRSKSNCTRSGRP